MKNQGSPLLQQLAHTLLLRQELLALRFPELKKNPNLEKERLYLTEFYKTALFERANRADEVESKEVQEANEIAGRFLSFTPYRTGCVDGRNKMVYVLGIPPGVGGDYRIPAGDPNEFVQKRGGGLKLLHGTNYEQALKGILLQNCREKKKIIIWDSHFMCAAQKLAVASIKPSYLFSTYNDDGRFEDVVRKKDIAQAVKIYADELGKGEQIDNIQISYDPRNNYLYMGLENYDVLTYAGEKGGFTDKNINALITQNKIISTQKLVDDPNIGKIFDQYYFDPEWKTDFRNTCLRFWKNIENISRTKAFDIIKNHVQVVYPSASLGQIEARAQTLLLNAFTGYLNNKADKVASGHIENIVVVTEREYGPFSKVSGFQVARTSGDIPSDTNLAAGIVAQNRLGQQSVRGIIDITGTYGHEEYIYAPISIMVQVIDRDGLPDWKRFDSQAFADLAQRDWLHMSEYQLGLYLRKKNPSVSYAAVELVRRLRDKAASFYSPYSPTKRSFSKGAYHALYTVADQNRRPLAILPLEFAGY